MSDMREIRRKAMDGVDQDKITYEYAKRILKSAATNFRITLFTNPHLLGMTIGIVTDLPAEVRYFAHRRFWRVLGVPEEMHDRLWESDEDHLTFAMTIIKQYTDEEIVKIMQEGL